MTISLGLLWSIAGILAVGIGLALIAVFLGGWLVYKAETITMPTPFVQIPKREDKRPASYVDDLFQDEPEMEGFEEDLSPAASRLRCQKLSPENPKRGVMKIVTGRK